MQETQILDEPREAVLDEPEGAAGPPPPPEPEPVPGPEQDPEPDLGPDLPPEAGTDPGLPPGPVPEATPTTPIESAGDVLDVTAATPTTPIEPAAPPADGAPGSSSAGPSSADWKERVGRLWPRRPRRWNVDLDAWNQLTGEVVAAAHAAGTAAKGGGADVPGSFAAVDAITGNGLRPSFYDWWAARYRRMDAAFKSTQLEVLPKDRRRLEAPQQSNSEKAKEVRERTPRMLYRELYRDASRAWLDQWKKYRVANPRQGRERPNGLSEAVAELKKYRIERNVDVYDMAKFRTDIGMPEELGLDHLHPDERAKIASVLTGQRKVNYAFREYDNRDYTLPRLGKYYEYELPQAPYGFPAKEGDKWHDAGTRRLLIHVVDRRFLPGSPPDIDERTFLYYTRSHYGMSPDMDIVKFYYLGQPHTVLAGLSR